MVPERLLDAIRTFKEKELTSDLVTRSQRYITDVPSLAPVVPKKQEEIFFPRYVDKLYWCFFIMKEGMAAYECLGKGVFAAETSSKIGIVSEIRKNADLLATHKKKSSIAAAEADLVGCPFISLQTFEILCIVSGLSVVVVKGKRAVRFLHSDKQPYVLWSNENGYGLGSALLDHGALPPGVVEVCDLEKPLKALTSYKKDDLVAIATKIGLEVTDKDGNPKLKSCLYQEILEVL